jgi:hypothetical protein
MSGVTPTDFDIVFAARSMIRVHGRDAAAEAAHRADADLANGDTASCTHVEVHRAAIEKLEAVEPALGERVQSQGTRETAGATWPGSRCA